MDVLAFFLLALAVFPMSLEAADVLDRLPFEVVINVHWQGKDLEIRKIASCDKRRRDLRSRKYLKK